MRVSVIIPTRNEAESIGRVLSDLPSDLVTEVLVVDSNSTDGTPEIAARMGARVISETRRGYGRACLTGLEAVSEPDVVVFLDGDYSDRPAELPLLLAPIAEGRADITIGSRLAGPRTPGALPAERRDRCPAGSGARTAQRTSSCTRSAPDGARHWRHPRA